MLSAELNDQEWRAVAGAFLAVYAYARIENEKAEQDDASEETKRLVKGRPHPAEDPVANSVVDQIVRARTVLAAHCA